MRLNIQSRWLEKYAPLEKNISANRSLSLHRARKAHRSVIGQPDEANSPNSVCSSRQNDAIRKTTGPSLRAFRVQLDFF